MELTAVPATQFSSVQLTDILNACFEAYMVPVTSRWRDLFSALAPRG